jgi:hypothetical protein
MSTRNECTLSKIVLRFLVSFVVNTGISDLSVSQCLGILLSSFQCITVLGFVFYIYIHK